ncbi:MAG: hypothetical protein EXS03_00225 [Phycisphaerales bacterium]|nr:hypothetical protein [Phycisphaerales bacterium]
MSEVPYQSGIPEPTSGPLVTALGTALLAAGLVTNLWVMMGGAVIGVCGLVVWFRGVFPYEQLEEIPKEIRSKVAPNYAMARPGAAAPRSVYPEAVPPYSSGIIGGLLGGIAMAAVASAWGLVMHGSVWLPINLLAGAVMPSVGEASEASLSLFNPEWFATACMIHVVLSVSVGTLYTITLPIVPRWPITAGAVMVPIIATGLVWACLSIVNPALDRHISWWWFVASQFAFGVVCGWWVGGRTPVSVRAGGSLADRLHIHRGGPR